MSATINMDGLDNEKIPSDILTEWMNVIDTTSNKSSPRANFHHSPSMGSVISDGDDWVLPDKLSLSRQSSYGTVSSFGAVLETESIMNMLGIQRVSSTSSLGIAESWETKADRRSRTPSSGSRTPILGPDSQSQNQLNALSSFAESLDLSMNSENVTLAAPNTPELSHQMQLQLQRDRDRGRKNKLSEFLSWCLPSKRSTSDSSTDPLGSGTEKVASLCPIEAPTSPNSSSFVSTAAIGVGPKGFSSRNGRIPLATIQELVQLECYDIDDEDDEEDEEGEDDCCSVPVHELICNLSDTL